MRKTILTIATLFITIIAFCQSQPQASDDGVVEKNIKYYINTSDSFKYLGEYYNPFVNTKAKHYYPFHIQITDSAGNVTSEAYYDMIEQKGELKGDVQAILKCLALIIHSERVPANTYSFYKATDFKQKNSPSDTAHFSVYQNVFQPDKIENVK